MRKSLKRKKAAIRRPTKKPFNADEKVRRHPGFLV